VAPLDTYPTHSSASVLRIEDLHVTYPGGAWAVRGIDLDIRADEMVAIIGESGCGKTTVARAVLGMLGPRVGTSGSITVSGHRVLDHLGERDRPKASERDLRRLRGRGIGYVAQDPYSACNPLHRVRRHVEEAWRAHRMRPHRHEVYDSLERIGIANAPDAAEQYPHEWSGGMLQRATIAAANAHAPPLLVADEPTTALDSAVASTVLSDLRSSGAAVLLISHSLSLVAGHADRVAVCYAGRVVEEGATAEILDAPRHPYTAALLAATPRRGHGLPQPLPGQPPHPSEKAPGCAFASRCREATEECRNTTPQLRDGVACFHR